MGKKPDLPALQKERTEEALERANLVSGTQKDKFLEHKDNSKGVLVPIVEELQKLNEPQKKSEQIFNKPEIHKGPEQTNKKEPTHVNSASPGKKQEETKSQSPEKKSKSETAKPKPRRPCEKEKATNLKRRILRGDQDELESIKRGKSTSKGSPCPSKTHSKN